MKNIFLAPRSNETSYENFESSIIGGRKYAEIESYLTVNEKQILSKYETLSIWGNKESLRSRWEKMQPGDYVLFYSKGFFYYSARVTLTKFSPELGRKFWPADEDGEPWPCLFFVDNLKEIKIPIQVVQQLADYEPTWDRVQGFMRLNDSGIAAIVEKFGNLEVFLNQNPETYETLENILSVIKEETIEDEKEQTSKTQLLAEALEFQSSTESHRINLSPHKIRVENRKQKKRVAALEDYACQVCNWSLEWKNSKGKKAYRIDIDHIIEKRDEGGEELNNLWALCPNCHVKKTLKVIKIDPAARTITENGVKLKLHHDNHLGWKV